MKILNYLKANRKKIKKMARRIVYVVATISVLGFMVVVILFIYYARQLPDPKELITIRVSESTKIYDRTGETVLFDVHGDENRDIVSWDQIPSTVRNATLAAEDDEFYQHHGIDFKGILRAFYRDVVSLNLKQGGSTITQQLIKNSLFGEEKTLSRKIKEAVFAIQVEREYKKDEIFWMYLNRIPYGSNIYGIEAASQAFFGKRALDLTNAQAAMIASLPKAPTYYSPYGNHVDKLMARKDFVLNQMHELGMITKDELETALAEELSLKPLANSIKAPHFVIMVREYLIEKYGEDVVQNGGLSVITTLDWEKQQLAEGLVKKYGDINETQYKAGNLAVVAADPKTGEILSLVGSRDYFNIEKEGNFNVATAQRQPGSSFKPFAYATAIERGFPDSTILFDVKTEFTPGCAPSALQEVGRNGIRCYHPENYLRNYSGPVTLRQSLARSLNIPSVKILYLAGVQNTINTATRMGITTLTEPSRYGLSLVLGGAEVRLVDMVAAYGAFANDGILAEQFLVQSVTTSDGRVLEQHEQKESRVLDTQVARMITSILSDNVARSATFGSNSPLFVPGKNAAAKTGTTQENRDGWIVGYTPSLVIGVWGGNNDNTSMAARGAGIGVSGPLWHDFISQATEGNGGYFVPPKPMISNKIMLNGTYDAADVHDILYYVDKNDPTGPAPINPGSDSLYSLWENAVYAWASINIPKPTPSPSPTPTNFEPSPSVTPMDTPIETPVDVTQ